MVTIQGRRAKMPFNRLIPGYKKMKSDLMEMRLAEMLCTRLCHDLTGPIGAVNNGVEFISEEGFDLQGQAVELITSSAVEAVHRLQLYRQAYGRVNEVGEASLSLKKQICKNFFANSKITLDWPDSHTDASGVSVSNKLARILLNVMIIFSTVMIRGGTVSVRVESVSQNEIMATVSGAGTTVKCDDDLRQVLEGKVEIQQVSPKTVQPFYTCLLIKDLGATLAYKFDTTTFEISIRHTPAK